MQCFLGIIPPHSSAPELWACRLRLHLTTNVFASIIQVPMDAGPVTIVAFHDTYGNLMQTIQMTT
jgi:hypothetical protein